MIDFNVINIDIGDIGFTHYFIYRKKKYPFNINVFALFSQFVQKNLDHFKQTKDIYLIEKENERFINLSEDSIKDFILLCQNKDIDFNNDNVVAIDYLTDKYKINKLHDRTQIFISEHENELKFQKYLLKTDQNNENNIQFEHEIIDNLSEYINNKQLLELPIPSIHRIINSKKIDVNQNFIDFLFACLDKYGRNASILFSNLDLGNLKIECMNLLLSKYSDIFDFHFINPIFTKELYELQNEQIKREEIIKIHQIESFNAVQKELNDVKEKQNELLSIIRNQQATIDNLKSTINQIKECNNKQLIKQDFNYDIKQNNSLNGIIFHLTNECGGNVHDIGIIIITSSSVYGSNFPKYVADFIKNNQNDHFMSNDERNSWLQYNFKKMKIRPTHYTIRTHAAGPKNCHLMNWCIEGSNNFLKEWTVLDTRRNITSLSSASATQTFEISNKLEQDEYYKFIRIKITGPNDANNYYLMLSSLEFFGSLIKYQ